MSVLLIIANTQQSSLQNYKKKQTYCNILDKNIKMRYKIIFLMNKRSVLNNIDIFNRKKRLSLRNINYCEHRYYIYLEIG